MSLHPALFSSLSVFATVARHQNFAHAADELHLTASAVSHHIRKLEAQLGLTLFLRHARGVALTVEGRLLADATGGALTDVENVVDALREDRRNPRVRISVLPSLATDWLMPRLGRFREAYPDILLSIESRERLARFDDGHLDLGVRYGAGQWQGVTARFLMSGALLPVASPAMAAGIQTPAQITQLPLIADLAAEGWREWFRSAGVPDAPLAGMYDIGNSANGLRAAASGLGAILARKQLVAPFLASGQLVRLPGPEVPTRHAYYIVHAADQRPKPAARRFIAWLEREAR
ncbi:MAG TPA: LysR substrate-binding domain-containing protein [Rhodanobacteraceae bacterium]